MKYSIPICTFFFTLWLPVNWIHGQNIQRENAADNPSVNVQTLRASRLIKSPIDSNMELLERKRLADSLRNTALLSSPSNWRKNEFPRNNKEMRKFPIQAKASYKNSMENTQSYLIDTVICYGTLDSVRYSYLYSLNGNVLRELIEQLNNGQWTSLVYDTMNYDANRRILSDLYKSWINGQWINSKLYTYTYDISGNELSWLSQNWEGNQWKDSVDYTYTTYNTNGNMLSQISEHWLNGKMTYSAGYIYTYDTLGNELSELRENWSNGQWTNITRDTYTYDTNGNKITDILEFRINGQWAKYFMDIYTYDARGNKISDDQDQWGNGQWMNYWTFTFTYDANDKELSELALTWTNGQWANGERLTYTYDIKGNELSALDETLNNGQWRNADLQTYTYDASGQKLSWLHQSWINGQWANGDRQLYAYDVNENLISFSAAVWVLSSWTPYPGVVEVPNGVSGVEGYDADSISIIYELVDITGIDANIKVFREGFALFQNYPNPFNPSTIIRYQLPAINFVTLKFYDMLGREVETLVNEQQAAGIHSVIFNSKGLSSGVYFYKIAAGNFVDVKKIVLLK